MADGTNLPMRNPDLAAVYQKQRELAAEKKRQEEEAAFLNNYAPPRSWGTLPETATFEDEIDWVLQNYLLVVKERDGNLVVNLNRARRPAPSYGALTFLKGAVGNFQFFVKELAPKAKRAASLEDSQEMIRAERKSIAQIMTILKRVEERDGKRTANPCA